MLSTRMLQSNPESVPFFVIGTLFVFLTIYGWQNRRFTACLPFSMMTGGLALWLFSKGFELISADLFLKWICYCVGGFGSSMGIWWSLAFVLNYQKRQIGHGFGFGMLFFIEPLLALLAAVTNPLHHLYWNQIHMVSSGKYLVGQVEFGPILFLHHIFCLAVVLYTLVKLIWMGWVTHRSYRLQTCLLAVAFGLPWLVGALELSGLVSFPKQMHAVLLSLGITGIILLVAIRKFRLLNITPAARESVFRFQKDAVVIFDNFYKVIDANDRALALFGRGTVGQDATVILRNWPSLLEKIHHQQEGEWEIQDPDPDRPKAFFDIRLWPIEESGRIIGFILSLRDVTARWILKEDLKAAKEAAEAANRAKSSFLANMSHEIRTPLGAISGYGDILMTMEDPTTEKGKILGNLRRNCSHLMQIIDDILDLSKIEAGKMELDPILDSPWKLMLDARSMLQAKAQEKGIDLRVSQGGGIPSVAWFDPTRMRQVLFNLLSNAIKFTESGKTVRAELSSRNPDPAGRGVELVFRVIDQGIGMTPSQVDQLFQPFHQADSSTSRRFGGTGLGLSIVHKLLTCMNGSIRVESVPGVGTTVEAVIPCPLPDGKVEWIDPQSVIEPAAKPEPTVKSLDATKTGPGLKGRLLLVEDNLDNQKILIFQLKKTGMEIDIANHGLEAIEKAAKNPFDIILMDMQMPICDGYTATNRLRAAGYTRPIVALTANAMKEDREKCLAAGCDDYLSKPVVPADLYRTIAQQLEKNQKVREPVGNETKAIGPVEPIALDRWSLEGLDEEMQPLVRSFATGLEPKARQLSAALTQRNIATIRSISHQLKGAGSMYGFPELTDAARGLEQSLLSREPISSIQSRAHTLSRLLSNLGQQVATVPESRIESPLSGDIPCVGVPATP